MNPPPKTLDGADVLLWASRSEAIYFISGGDTRLPVMAMAICRYKKSSHGPGSTYLFKCDGEWDAIQDSQYNSIEQGMVSASQWGVRRDEWKYLTAAGEEAVWLDGVSIIDQEAFERRGAGGCSNSDFRLKRTTCCGSTGVEDEEMLVFYTDPTDLSRRIYYDADCVCPFCGASEWGLKEIKALAEVSEGWRWACRSRWDGDQNRI